MLLVSDIHVSTRISPKCFSFHASAKESIESIMKDMKRKRMNLMSSGKVVINISRIGLVV